MTTDTSTSLLDCLRQTPDAQAWTRLVDLYTPLVQGWLRRYSVPQHDADDVVQEVLVVVLRKIREFERRPQTGAFRKWLRTITVNCLRDFWRVRKWQPLSSGEDLAAALEQLARDDSQLSRMWDEEHDKHVTKQLLEQIKQHFSTQTYQAFTRVALEGATPAQAANELGMTENAVFIAKSRVLRRLREEGAGLID